MDRGQSLTLENGKAPCTPAELLHTHPAIYETPFLDRDAFTHSKRLNAKLALQEVHRT